MDKASIASLIIMKSLLSRQSKIDSRIDKVDVITVVILQLLQSRKASNL